MSEGEHSIGACHPALRSCNASHALMACELPWRPISITAQRAGYETLKDSFVNSDSWKRGRRRQYRRPAFIVTPPGRRGQGHYKPRVPTEDIGKELLK
eukprot:2558446-Pyramimonas_sp.AAC.1